MTYSPSGDQLQAERLDPDQGLTERRNKRDEEDYRVWCETSYGMVNIGQEQFHPAHVLEMMAPAAAQRGRDDWSAMIRRDLEQAVCEQFPAPVAVPFHSFLEGPPFLNRTIAPPAGHVGVSSSSFGGACTLRGRRKLDISETTVSS